MNVTELQELLKEKQEELEHVQESFSEFQEMSKTIEQELEEQISDLKSELESTLQENNRLIDNINETKQENKDLKDSINELKKNFANKSAVLEKNIYIVTTEKDCFEAKLKGVTKLAKEYEIELDKFKDTLREKEFEIEQVTSFYHKTLEDLAITCSELESIKDSSMEDIQRMKNQISELSSDLAVARRKSRSFSTHTAMNAVRHQKTHLIAYSRGSAIGMVDNLISDLTSRLKTMHLS